jgi:hypothetical protein
MLAAIVIVNAVLFYALMSMNPADPVQDAAYKAASSGSTGTGTAAVSASHDATVTFAITAGGPAELYVKSTTSRPVPLEADIEVIGWRDQKQHIIETSIDEIMPIEAPSEKGAGRNAYSSPIKALTEQLKGRTVLASVGPRAASVLPSSGKAKVNLIVTPLGQTATLVIDEVLQPRRSPAAVPTVAGAALPGPTASFATDAPTDGTAPVSAAAARPVVKSLSAYWGKPGTRVTMAGSGFGSSKASSWVTCAGRPAKVVYWSSTKVIFSVPGAMKTAGYVGAVVGGKTSNGLYFSPFEPPVVESVTPRDGAPGTIVTINGYGFGDVQGDGWVTFGGISGQVVSWTDVRIKVIVPRGAQAAYVGVAAHGMTSNGVMYGPLGTPVIESVSERVLLPGANVTVRGTGFGYRQGSVIVGGTKVTPTSWGPQEVAFTVPGRVGGYLGVTRPDGWTSNGVWMPGAPRVTALSSWWGQPSGDLAVHGVGFGATRGTQNVYIGGKAATPKSWSDTSIVFTLPSNATSGYVGVGTSSACSNGLYLLVETPAHIDSVSNKIVSAGDTITITGTGFGAAASSSRVLLAGTIECPVVSWSENSITAVISAGARTGYVGVVKHGVSSNGVWVMVP